jgi:hypothetical protein
MENKKIKTDKNGKAYKGSQRHLQIYVNEETETINKKISEVLEIDSSTIKWKAPLKEKQYKEPVDKGFWNDIIGKEFKKELNKNYEFWPHRGANWDGVAIAENKAGEKILILIEAKAHKEEIGENTKCKAKAQKSIDTINRSIKNAQNDIKIKSCNCWTTHYYQMANRLTHTIYLNEQGIKTYLIYVYFLKDEGWPDDDEFILNNDCQEVINKEKKYLGINGNNKVDALMKEIYLEIPNKNNYPQDLKKHDELNKRIK